MASRDVHECSRTSKLINNLEVFIARGVPRHLLESGPDRGVVERGKDTLRDIER
jgi:hypothetical protein